MAAHIQSEKAFIEFILNTSSKHQGVCLIKHITLPQTTAITEIFLNLLKGVIDDSKEIGGAFKKYSKDIRIIGAPKIALRKRKAWIVRKAALVFTILKALKSSLTELL